MAALAGSGMRFYASEEQEQAIGPRPPPAGWRWPSIPLDGSSNIDVNVSIGTIFAIYAAAETADATFLRPGRELVAAGYVIYGPQCCLVASFGDGVHEVPARPGHGAASCLAADGLASCRRSPREFAINASNYRHWPKPVRAFSTTAWPAPTARARANFNMRWIASLVAETHRIMTRGGVFLYPADKRKGYERGRLRLALRVRADRLPDASRPAGAPPTASTAILDRAPAAPARPHPLRLRIAPTTSRGSPPTTTCRAPRGRAVRPPRPVPEPDG